MKKLLLAVLVLAGVCVAQNTRVNSTSMTGRLQENLLAVTFSATPTFDASLTNNFKIVLTGNVTSSTLSNAVAGEPLAFEVCQDGTGGRTFVPPANVSLWVTISGTASTCTMEFYLFDGTNAMPGTISLSGDVTISGSIVTVAKVNGVSFPSGPSSHSVPVVTAANTITYKVITDCTDTTGNHLNYTQSTDAWSCGTSAPTSVAPLASPTFTGTVGLPTVSQTGLTTKYNNITTSDFGLTPIVGTPVHLTGQTVALVATNILAAPVTGTYKLYVYARTTTSGSGTTAAFTIVWADDGGTKTFTSGNFALNTTALTGQINLILPFRLNSGTALTVSVAGTFGTSVYAIDAWVEREN